MSTYIDVEDLPTNSADFVPGESVDPEQFNAAFAEQTRPDEPVIREPDPGLVELEYGVDIEGERVKDVIVRELNGADEEHLAKISQAKAGQAFYVLIEDAIIRRATETIGGHKATKELLDRLLVADRGKIFTQILLATFGDKRSFRDVKCPTCDGYNDFDIDIPERIVQREMKTDEPQTAVKLRGNRKYPKVKEIIVRYPNGGDQLHIYQEKKDATESEINTAMLARCIVNDSIGDKRDFALSLGLADRKAAIKAIYDNQPMTTFEEVTVQCSHCSETIPFVFGWADLLFD